MDTAHRVTTILIVLLLGLLIFKAFHIPDLRAWAPSLVIALVIVIAWQMRPSAYQVSDEGITIVRGWPFKSVMIPTGQIHNIRQVTIHWTTIRYGVGGLFSTGGWLWNRELGRFFAAYTNRHKLVLIENGGKYVISPENPEEFIADLGK